MLVSNVTRLDVKQCFAQLHRDGAGLALINLPMATFTALDLTYRGDDGSRATGEDFSDFAGLRTLSPLIHTDRIFGSQIPKVSGHGKQ